MPSSKPPVFFRPPGDAPPPPTNGNGNGRSTLSITAPTDSTSTAVTPVVTTDISRPAGPADLPYQFRPAPAPTEIDYEVVATLQATVGDRIRDRVLGRDVLNAELRAITEEETRRVVNEHVDHRIQAGDRDQVPPGYADALIQAVTAFLLGLGRLQPLIDDPDVENIAVLGYDQVRVEYADGRVEENAIQAAASDADLIEMLQRLAARGGNTERTWSTSKPVLHLRLPDGSRLVAVYVVTPRPVAVIRRHRIKNISLDGLVDIGSITPILAAFLKAVVAGDISAIIAGEPGSGKTTLLRAIASEIPATEWFATMETEHELGLPHPWVIPIEERQGHGEIGANGRPEGELALADLFADTLRMNVRRVVVGEVRKAEIVSMFDAGDTTQGTLSTIHARRPHLVFDRLASLLMRYGASPNPQGAYMQIVNAVDLVVFQRRDRRTGRRYVSHVLEVNGLSENGIGIARSELFAPRTPGGLAEPTGVRPANDILDALLYGGFDPQLLTGDGTWQRGR
ncbi:CpaF family protein [Actinoplanes sp. G11-F43]|uniref:CpaF family protein n=1 Tax=Actinoplanes sp. G11-F43 TaxID=3424130 RepID=UPI003D34FE7E